MLHFLYLMMDGRCMGLQLPQLMTLPKGAAGTVLDVNLAFGYLNCGTAELVCCSCRPSRAFKMGRCERVWWPVPAA